MTLALHLRTLDPEMAAAWESVFEHPSVTIAVGDILETKADAILSPANSFGFMDGGIDLLYSRHFGWELQDNLQALLADRFQGELPVGQAVVVPTANASLAYLVSAPTIRIPQIIEHAVNVPCLPCGPDRHSTAQRIRCPADQFADLPRSGRRYRRHAVRSGCPSDVGGLFCGRTWRDFVAVVGARGSTTQCFTPQVAGG